MNSPIKYHGGKHYLAPRIIELFPEHKHYVEPFFGGGAVLFRKPPEWIEGVSEIVNDVNGDLINFWRVLKLKHYFARFKRVIEATPFAQIEFQLAAETDGDPVERAVAFFVRARQSRQGLAKDFATMSRTRTRRGMNEQASSWWSAIDGLPDVYQRLQRVVIYNSDAIDVIRQQDGAMTFVYADPPYMRETRTSPDAYAFEMSDKQHRSLLDTLSSMKGKFLLSGYRCPLYDQYAERFGWHRVDIAIDNKASGKKTKDIKTESLWRNYDAVRHG